MKKFIKGIVGAVCCLSVCVGSFWTSGVTGGATQSQENGLSTVQDVSYNATVEVTDYDYSFMVVGDTQVISQRDNEGTNGTEYNFPKIYDWIVSEVEERKVKHVFGLGDITQYSRTTEWEHVLPQIAKMDGVVPYSLVRGNHDMATGVSNSFGQADYAYHKQYFTSYDHDAGSTAHEFSAGGLDYLVLALDWGPDEAVLEWACDIVEAHPNHNVIVSTHAYMDEAGTLLCEANGNKVDGRDNGDVIWEKLVSQYENIVMLLCGHVDTPGIVLKTSEGVHGNTVQQLLINPQGLDITSGIGQTGMVSTFYVSNGGKTITADCYSTIQQKSFPVEHNTENYTLTFNLDVVERAEKTTAVGEAARAAIGLTANTSLVAATGKAKNGVSDCFTAMTYLTIDQIEEISVGAGYQICWAAYDSRKTYLGNGNAKAENWLTAGTSFTPQSVYSLADADYSTATYVRVTIKKVDGSAVAYADLDASGLAVTYR